MSSWCQESANLPVLLTFVFSVFSILYDQIDCKGHSDELERLPGFDCAI